MLSALRWDMTAAQVRSMLANHGLAIAESWGEVKGQWHGWFVVETKGWRATFYFAEPKPGTPVDGAMLDQLHIDGEFARGRSEVDRVVGELRGRLGPEVGESEDRTWRWDGADTRLVVSLDPVSSGLENDGWKVDEQWTPAGEQEAVLDELRLGRDPTDVSSPRSCADALVGPLGRRELAWQMSPAEVVAALRGSPVVVGPEVKDTLVGPRDNIDPAPRSSASFEDGVESGTLEFRAGRLASVRRLEIVSLPGGDEALLQSYRERFGEPCWWSEGQALEWRDGPTAYGVQVVHVLPSDEWAVHESRHREPHVVRGGSQGRP